MSTVPYCYRCFTNHRSNQACAWIAGEKRLGDGDIADPPVFGFQAAPAEWKGTEPPTVDDRLRRVTVGELKRLVNLLPDDMPIVARDGHTGEEDDVVIHVSEDVGEYDRPTLEIMLG